MTGLAISVAAYSHDPCPHEPGRISFREWIKKVGLDQGKMYSVPATREKQIKTGYEKIHLGSSLSEVEKALGLPDVGGAARSHTFTDDRQWCGYEWSYYIRKTDTNEASMDDVGLFIFFDSRGNLVWASLVNVKGLREKGSPL
jgi:hypothetical protein